MVHDRYIETMIAQVAKFRREGLNVVGKSKDRRTFERAMKKSLGKERTSGFLRRMYTNMASWWRTVVSVRDDVGFGGVCRIDSAHESARTPTSVIVATWPPP